MLGILLDKFRCSLQKALVLTNWLFKSGICPLKISYHFWGPSLQNCTWGPSSVILPQAPGWGPVDGPLWQGSMEQVLQSPPCTVSPVPLPNRSPTFSDDYWFSKDYTKLHSSTAQNTFEQRMSNVLACLPGQLVVHKHPTSTSVLFIRKWKILPVSHRILQIFLLPIKNLHSLL